ncbi:MAG: triose-phosphate isomerase [Patescibacteria group bacterium]|nr:triose-phosphate isomerase [Patescibacteria group bacterium]
MSAFMVANWKENPETEAEALGLFRKLAKIPRNRNTEIVICPPFVYLEKIAEEFKNLESRARLALGGQDIFWEKTGAFTGEIGPTMLRSLGAAYAIIGHSERRKFLRETDEMVNKKVVASLEAGLKVILCVGEPLAIRRQGFTAAKKFVRRQLAEDLRRTSHIKFQTSSSLVIAYEPIWAIGTGKNCPPFDAARMAAFIKLQARHLKPPVRVLYGGSVNSKNIADYLKNKEIGGALVGGASLNAAEFGRIIKAAGSR